MMKKFEQYRLARRVSASPEEWTTTCQIAFSSAMDLPTTRSPLFTGRKIFPSVIFAARVQASTLTFTAAGMVTVRRRFPLPTRSGMTQRPSRCWMRSTSRRTSSAAAQPARDQKRQDGAVALAFQS